MMFCKNCGAKIADDAKFCESCGTKVGETSYTAPKPFEKNSVDGSQNYQYQNSTFKGAQYSTGTSGSVSFGRKKGFFGKLVGFIIVAVILYFVITWLFGGTITNARTSTLIDGNTYEAVDPTDTFATNTPEIYVSFRVNGVESGTVIESYWFYMSSDPITFIDSSAITLLEDANGQYGYFSMLMPTSGWPVGDYDIDIYVGDEEFPTITVSFTVE